MFAESFMIPQGSKKVARGRRDPWNRLQRGTYPGTHAGGMREVFENPGSSGKLVQAVSSAAAMLPLTLPLPAAPQSAATSWAGRGDSRCDRSKAVSLSPPKSRSGTFLNCGGEGWGEGPPAANTTPAARECLSCSTAAASASARASRMNPNPAWARRHWVLLASRRDASL